MLAEGAPANWQAILALNTFAEAETKLQPFCIRHFKCISWTNYLGFRSISLPCAPSCCCLIYKRSGIVQITGATQMMALRRTCDKPLSDTMMTQFIDAYMPHKSGKHHSHFIPVGINTPKHAHPAVHETRTLIVPVPHGKLYGVFNFVFAYTVTPI